jgi:hypothetical protein
VIGAGTGAGFGFEESKFAQPVVIMSVIKITIQ